MLIPSIAVYDSFVAEGEMLMDLSFEVRIMQELMCLWCAFWNFGTAMCIIYKKNHKFNAHIKRTHTFALNSWIKRNDCSLVTNLPLNNSKGCKWENDLWLWLLLYYFASNYDAHSLSLLFQTNKHENQLEILIKFDYTQNKQIHVRLVILPQTRN